jgi:hypothetical protein
MLKKLAVLMLAVQGFSIYADPVVENFDCGPGVPGRELFKAGSPVDGILVQSGNTVFKDVGRDPSAFSNAGGPGRGVLSMKGGSCAVGFAYPVSGITVMKAEGRFFPGTMTQGVRGFWVGVQSAAADKALLNNQSTDRLAVQLNPSGAVIFRSVVGGVTNNSSEGTDGRVEFSPGDLVKMELTVNMAEKTASVKVTGPGADNEKVRTLRWPSDKNPDWGMMMINQTGNGELLLDSVEVRTEQPPRIVG